MEPESAALLEIGRWLKTAGYAFTTPTPLTIDRVNTRPENLRAISLAGVFGWNRPFAEDLLPDDLLQLMRQAAIVERHHHLLRSKVRFSSLAGALYVHSAYPTLEPNAVFFGPDTSRFVRLVRDKLIERQIRPARLIDLGCGSGAGGLSIARLLPPTGIDSIILSDINEKALRFAAINAALGNAQRVRLVQGDLFSGLPKADLIISNPPYLVDARKRTYRHGGSLGIELSLRIATEALAHLAAGGCLILYTGTPIVSGEDCFRTALEPELRARGVSYSYEELDPDVFGEELEQVAYAHAERISLVAVTVDAR